MKTLLCAFDFSKQSENALITSDAISKVLNLQLNVVYFISPESYGLATPEIEKQEKQNRIENFLKEKNINAKIHIKLQTKPIPLEILELAQSLNSKLIAIGRSSYDIGDVNFIGSNAISLKSISEIPILFGVITPRTSFKNILLPVNEKPSSLEPMLFAIDFAKNTDAKIHIVNVFESSISVPVEAIRLQEEKINQAIKLYENLLKDVEYSLNIVVSKDASSGILEYANNKEIDLIIMGRRKSLNWIERLFYSSTTSRVLRSTIVPFIAY